MQAHLPSCFGFMGFWCADRLPTLPSVLVSSLGLYI